MVVDSTMLKALSAVASKQAMPTKKSLKKIKQFLDYATSNTDTVIMCKASDMILATHIDAVSPKHKARLGEIFSCQQTSSFCQIMMQSTTLHKY